jgi:hypothetical protein
MVSCSRFKKQKIEHGSYSTHKRLGAVKTMDRQEMDATKLTEAIQLSARRHMVIWSSSRPTRNVVNLGGQNRRV